MATPTVVASHTTAVPWAGNARTARWTALVTGAILVLSLGVIAVTAVAYVRGAMSYVDNGDGYYLYASSRVAHGATLYRQVLGTQPPVVYLLGAVAVKCGLALPGLRLLSAAMRALSAALVYLLGRRLFANSPLAALAALVYAALPIGMVWDRSFDVNAPLTLITLLAALPLPRLTPRAVRIAGLLAAVALFTKNLYLPLLAATLAYLVLRQRSLVVPYLRGLLAGAGALALALVAYAGTAGLHDAFLGQESSPPNAAWFGASLGYVGGMEGGVVLVALCSAVVCHRAERVGTGRGPRAYAPWFLAGSAAVLLATLKEGTFGTVFVMAEPAVALMAAYGVGWALRRWRARQPYGIAALLLPVVLVLSSALAYQTGHAAVDAADNTTAVERVVALVRARAASGSVVVAPPYYALLSGTRLPGDAADTYIVAQRVRRGDPSAVTWLRRVTAAIDARRIPVVLIDLRLAAMTALMDALRAHYRPIYTDTLSPALRVTVWAPDARALSAPRAARL